MGTVEKTKISMQHYCRLLPKIELHAHLNGSLNKKILKELGCQEDSIEEYTKLNKVDNRKHTLDECFDVFKVAQDATKTQESVYLATKSVIEDFARDGVVYLELRTTPRSEANMSKEEYIESVIRGIKKSECCVKNIIIVKLILSIDRRHNKETSEDSLKIILKMREKYPDIIKGLDYSGDPRAGEFNAALFEEARKGGLKITIHCAELKNDEETRRILEFEPDRIGHATFLHPKHGGSQENWDLYCQKRIPIECCLTSNVVCGTSDGYPGHHIQEWINEKLPYSINTDDKGVFSTTLSKEYLLAQRHFKLSVIELWLLCHDAIIHSFASTKEKEKLENLLTKWSVCAGVVNNVDPNIDEDFDIEFGDMHQFI